MTHKENITAILECCFTGFKDEIIENACKRILEQEQKTGYWTKVLGIFICSCCELGSSDEYDYCPNCGARMIESEE